ncbi:MAG: glycosyltransferase [Fibrobacterota bacterium]|nr:MAG: glycosyltransferase [Fibrobacterota bacterium]
MGEKVSVAICTWNGERWIAEQLRSIISQTREVDEIVLIDDGSSDQTLQIAKALLSESGLPHWVFQNTANVGSSKNFQLAAEKCTGDVLLFSDQDDSWKPNKVERILEVLQENPDAQWAFSDLELCDGSLNSIGKTMWQKVGFGSTRLSQFMRGEQLEVILKRPIVTGAGLALRQSCLKECTPFQTPWIHDHWISLVLSGKGHKGIAISECLVKYRLHQSQQVGARQAALSAQITRSVQTGPAGYLEECDALRKLHPYLCEKENGWGLVSKKIEHFQARAELRRRPRIQRVATIARELSNGNYRFSWSWLAPLNDLIRA